MAKKTGFFESEIWNDISQLEDLNKQYHLNEIAKKGKKTPVIMEERLDLAVKEKILEKKGRERRIFYKLNPEDKRVKRMLKQMRSFRKGAINMLSLIEIEKSSDK